MEWAKTRPSARFDLAISNVLACTLADLPGAPEALALAGRNDNGYEPLLEAIATRYRVRPSQVTTAQGTSGANFLLFAALFEPGDDVLVERPGYDPLAAAPRLVNANVVPFERAFDEGYALDPERVAAAITPRTKLIVVTTPHNPSGSLARPEALREIGRIAAARGAYVLVDEVYLDTVATPTETAANYGDPFIVTSSLTKSYGLAALRCGWIVSSAEIAARLRRVRDVVDGTGSIVAERLSVLAFARLDHLRARTRALLDVNMPLALEFLRRRPELQFVEPGGGTVVFPKLLGEEDTTAFADLLLKKHDTAVVPGRFFQSPAHFRLGFSGSTEALRGGLSALARALDARGW